MYTLFYTADIQGSLTCWKKLLNAAELFRADALIVSGNLIGTALQPIVREKGGNWCTLVDDRSVRVKEEGEISALEEKIRSLGRYPCRVSPEEALELEQSPAVRQERLAQEARLSMRLWLDLAEHKLKKGGQRLIMIPGPGDPLFIDEIFKESPIAEWGRQKCITLTPGHKLIDVGTFHSGGADDSRQYTEEELYQHLQDQVRGLDQFYSNVFNIQLPPQDSILTSGSRLNCIRGKVSRSEPCKSSGCAAVRRFIETYQPLLTLHGSTRGRENKFTHIGRTLCCVPGDNRLERLLSGFIVTLNESEIMDFQPVQG
jgi:uncharacterized protein